MAEVIAADQRQRQSVVLHQNIRYIRCPGLPGSNHHRSALFQCHRHIGIAVGGEAGDRHKGAAGGHLPGIVGNAGDLGVHIHIGFPDRNVFK